MLRVYTMREAIYELTRFEPCKAYSNGEVIEEFPGIDMTLQEAEEIIEQINNENMIGLISSDDELYARVRTMLEFTGAVFRGMLRIIEWEDTPIGPHD